MNPLVLHFGSGAGFFSGCGLVLIGLLLAVRARGKWGLACGDVLVLTGVAAVVLASTPLPKWFYAVGAAMLADCLMTVHGRRFRQVTKRVVTAVTAMVVCVGVVWEWRYQVLPAVPAPPAARLYVIGDSITAGIGREGGRTSPKVFQEFDQARDVEVHDWSVGAETLGTALSRLRDRRLDDGMVLLEIGGNDMLGGASGERFGRELEQLLRRVTGPGRVVVMMELPLEPLKTDLGRAQRRLASQYGVTLIPKRYFATLFAGPGMTLDGLHLSAAGHDRMARVIWSILGPSLTAGKVPATSRPATPPPARS